MPCILDCSSGLHPPAAFALPAEYSAFSKSRRSRPRHPLIGFLPLRRFRFEATCVRLPRLTLRHPQGFSTLSAPSSPLRASRRLFHPGPPVGFSPSGPFLPMDRSGLSALAYLHGVGAGGMSASGCLACKVFIPIGGRHPPLPSRERRAAALLGSCLSRVLFLPVSPSFGDGRLLELLRTAVPCGSAGRRLLEATSRKADPTFRSGLDPLEVSSPFHRGHRSGLRSDLAMSSLGASRRLAASFDGSIRSGP